MQPAGLIRPINLRGQYSSAASLLQRQLLSWKPDADLHQCHATHAHSGAFRTYRPFNSVYGRNTHICHLGDFGSWRSFSDALTSFLGQVLVHEVRYTFSVDITGYWLYQLDARASCGRRVSNLKCASTGGGVGSVCKGGASPVRVARPLAITKDAHTRAARRWGVMSTPCVGLTK